MPGASTGTITASAISWNLGLSGGQVYQHPQDTKSHNSFYYLLHYDTKHVHYIRQSRLFFKAHKLKRICETRTNGWAGAIQLRYVLLLQVCSSKYTYESGKIPLVTMAKEEVGIGNGTLNDSDI